MLFRSDDAEDTILISTATELNSFLDDVEEAIEDAEDAVKNLPGATLSEKTQMRSALEDLEDDVEDVIDNLLEQHAISEPVDRNSQTGDLESHTGETTDSLEVSLIDSPDVGEEII